ncbi:hypothetical protein [Novosphingobium sp.]|uniref:hypothetical protein n=1 Tax=Novosphingobium sp. TaxID=1874826 RepID=UPI0033424DA6
MTEQRTYPPFHIDADADALTAIGVGIASIVPMLNRYQPDHAGPRAELVWIKDSAGTAWAITANQRDLEFKFEVFSLSIENEAALKTRIETGNPLPLPDDAPDWLRTIAAVPRMAPVPPADLQPPPFQICRTDVLRRAEFIMSDVHIEEALGENPNLQTAAVPENVPSNADACCIVSVALLFTGLEGQRLLVGVDWFPLNLIMTAHPDAIDDYTADCEMIEICEYAEMLHK